jgi:hypothetical protein
MAQLTIHWTETAIRQRNYIFGYWIKRNQSTTYAKKLNEKIKEFENNENALNAKIECKCFFY